jgi:WhiB family redox-sensing transcriptional regulator
VTGDREWRAQALCAQVDFELFFPEKGGTASPAKSVCQLCDVRAACLEWALATDQRFGVWGGTTERERRKLNARAAA